MTLERGPRLYRMWRMLSAITHDVNDASDDVTPRYWSLQASSIVGSYNPCSSRDGQRRRIPRSITRSRIRDAPLSSCCQSRPRRDFVRESDHPWTTSSHRRHLTVGFDTAQARRPLRLSSARPPADIRTRSSTADVVREVVAGEGGAGGDEVGGCASKTIRPPSWPAARPGGEGSL